MTVQCWRSQILSLDHQDFPHSPLQAFLRIFLPFYNKGSAFTLVAGAGWFSEFDSQATLQPSQDSPARLWSPWSELAGPPSSLHEQKAAEDPQPRSPTPASRPGRGGQSPLCPAWCGQQRQCFRPQPAAQHVCRGSVPRRDPRGKHTALLRFQQRNGSAHRLLIRVDKLHGFRRWLPGITPATPQQHLSARTQNEPVPPRAALPAAHPHSLLPLAPGPSPLPGLYLEALFLLAGSSPCYLSPEPWR